MINYILYMRMSLYFIIPILFLTLVYYVFGSTVFTALLTTLITFLSIGVVLIIYIFRRFIKPTNDSGKNIGDILKKFKKN
jgi:membrane protein implicated in regulation of membrane protease activity